MLKKDLASIRPSALSPFTPRIIQIPIIAPQKYPATLLCSHTWIHSSVLFLPLLRSFSIFFMHFLAPCLPACLYHFPVPPLSLSCFPLISPPQVLFPSHLCVWLLSCSLNVAAASLLPPPQASSAKLGAAALLWCSMHF